jgi:uncharacterized protein (TIRG00374 family)
MVYVGFWSVVEQFFTLGLKWFLVFLGLQLVLMFLWCLKWWTILRRYGIPFRRLLPVSFFGYFMNNITPMGLAGGEPIRAYVLSKVEDISFEDSAASVIVDLFLEVLPLLFMILLAIYYVFYFGVGPIVFILLSVAFVFISFVLFFILLLAVNEKLAETIIEKTVSLVAKIPVGFLKDHALDAKTRLDSVIQNFKDAMRTTLTDSKLIFAGTIISTLVWAVNIFRVYLIFRMLGVDLTFPVLIVTRVTVLSVSFLGVIPGALGFWEGTTTLVFSYFGVLASTAMAAVLVERLFSFIVANLIGFSSAAYLGYTHLVSRYLE